MKTVILTLIAAGFLLAQNSPQNKDTKPGKDASQSQPSSIPKEAVRVEPNLYRYVDAQGKTWFYRQLPFGVSKWEDKPAEPHAVEEQPAAVVRDLGDSVEFQRKTPFGISKWVTKKTDLTDEEKGLLAADEAKRDGASRDIDKSREKQEKH